MFRPLTPLALMLALASCQAGAVLAQNKPVSGLTPRGAVVGTDQIPDLPSGATSLQAVYAKDLKAYTLTSFDAFGADPTGVADSTTAIQAAYNSGLPLSCSGTYKTSASILIESPVNDGQTTTGGGSWGQPDAFNGTIPPGACRILPTSAVTGGVFVIDGTPFAGGGVGVSWVQGFSLSNLVIDMTNMTDVATNAAIEQIQAWDGHYTNVRVIHDGVNKRAYLAKAGAYTTTLLNFQGHIVDFEGTSTSNEVTTITLINPDIGQLVGNYVNGLYVGGGSLQPGKTASAVYLRNAAAIWMSTDIESTGTTTFSAYNLDNTVSGLWLHDDTQGWTGPIGDTGPTIGFVDLDLTSRVFSPGGVSALTTGYFNFNNYATGANSDTSSIVSGSLTHPQLFGIGRTSNEAYLCLAAATNGCMGSPTIAGDVSLYSIDAGSHLLLGAAGNPGRSYDGNGHEEVMGYPLPTVGTGTASIVGNDNLFVATAGSAVTSSAVNFSTGGVGWATTPTCVVSGNTAAAFPFISAVSTTAITIGWSAAVTSASATVRCALHN